MTAADAAESFHVAIVGAGIAGLALAMGLQRRGVPFTLYEEAAAYSAVGAGIGFAPNGLQALDLIEPGFRPLYEAIAVGNKPDNAQHVFFEGMLLEQGLGHGEQWFGKSSWGHPDFCRKSAHRKALLDIMTGFIPIEKVKFSKRLTRIEHQADQSGVELSFADGEVVRASVLIGADGIQSTTREYVLGLSHPEQVHPVYADAYCYRAVIPIAEAEEILGDLTHVAKSYFGDRRCAVTYRISGGEEFNFLLCVHHEGGWPYQGRVTDRTTHEEMMSDFQDRGIDECFLRLLSKANPVKWGLFHHLHTATYVKDRVVLCGDSAHASLPWQAAGAAQGVEDALVLCSLLSAVNDHANKQENIGPSLEAALYAYDTVRRPRAQRQLEQALDNHRMIFWQGNEGRDMDRILAKLQGEQRFRWLWFTDMRGEVERALSEYQRRSHDKEVS